MNYEHNHYFIELLHDLAPHLSSGEAVAARLDRARDFVAEIRRWLEGQHLTDDVSALKTTALGRIMITCAPDIIDRLQDLDHPDVISISLSTPMPVPAPTVLGRSA